MDSVGQWEKERFPHTLPDCDATSQKVAGTRRVPFFVCVFRVLGIRWVPLPFCLSEWHPANA